MKFLHNAATKNAGVDPVRRTNMHYNSTLSCLPYLFQQTHNLLISKFAFILETRGTWAVHCYRNIEN